MCVRNAGMLSTLLSYSSMQGRNTLRKKQNTTPRYTSDGRTAITNNSFTTTSPSSQRTTGTCFHAVVLNKKRKKKKTHAHNICCLVIPQPPPLPSPTDTLGASPTICNMTHEGLVGFPFYHGAFSRRGTLSTPSVASGIFRRHKALQISQYE